MSDKILVNGMFYRKPHDNAPDFVKGQISLKLDEFAQFVKEHKDGDWMNMDMLVSKGGKIYFALNTWKPKEAAMSQAQDIKTPDFEDDIPF